MLHRWISVFAVMFSLSLAAWVVLTRGVRMRYTTLFLSHLNHNFFISNICLLEKGFLAVNSVVFAAWRSSIFFFWPIWHLQLKIPVPGSPIKPIQIYIVHRGIKSRRGVLCFAFVFLTLLLEKFLLERHLEERKIIRSRVLVHLFLNNAIKLTNQALFGLLCGLNSYSPRILWSTLLSCQNIFAVNMDLLQVSVHINVEVVDSKLAVIKNRVFCPQLLFFKLKSWIFVSEIIRNLCDFGLWYGQTLFKCKIRRVEGVNRG